MKSILFDLDGTLTDPKLGITRSIQYALTSLGLTSPAEDDLTQWIGPPLRASFAHLLETTDPDYIERAITLYRDRFATIGLYENEVYSGITEMLTFAKSIAAQLYIATSKPTIFATRISAHFGLTEFFTKIYGTELDGRFDHKADLLAHLLKTEKLDHNCCVMIGDRSADIIAAKANHIRSIGVTWGYGSSPELREAGADFLCASPTQLMNMLSNIVTEAS